MANKKISQLPAFSGTPASTDVLPMVDVSGTATTKKVSLANIVNLANVGNLRAANNLSDVADASSARGSLSLGTAATSASTDFSPAFFTTVAEITTTRTLSNSDNGKVIVCSNSSAVTITIPSGLTAGFYCKLVQLGTGKVTILAGSGATIQNYIPSGSAAYNSTAGQYAAIEIVTTSSNNYILAGERGVGPFANEWSVSLDGTNQYIDCGNVTGINSIPNLTTSSWVNFNVIGTDEPVLIGGYGSSNNDFSVQLYTSGSLRYLHNGNFETITFSALSTGTWYNFTTVQSGTNLSFYIDGNIKGTATVSAIGSGWGTSFTIGKWAGGSFNYLDGYIDEVALWSSALSADNVSAISSAPIDLKADLGNYDQSSTLLNWWRNGDNNSGQGTGVTDNKGSDNGILRNGASFTSTTAP